METNIDESYIDCIVKNTEVSSGTVSLFPVSEEGKRFTQKYEDGVSPRLPSKYKAIHIASHYPIMTILGKEKNKTTAITLDDNSIETLRSNIETSSARLKLFSDYLSKMIGKNITMKNRYGNPKTVKLVAVSKPMMLNGAPINNCGFLSKAFVEVIIS